MSTRAYGGYAGYSVSLTTYLCVALSRSYCLYFFFSMHCDGGPHQSQFLLRIRLSLRLHILRRIFVEGKIALSTWCFLSAAAQCVEKSISNHAINFHREFVLSSKVRLSRSSPFLEPVFSNFKQLFPTILCDGASLWLLNSWLFNSASIGSLNFWLRCHRRCHYGVIACVVSNVVNITIYSPACGSRSWSIIEH